MHSSYYKQLAEAFIQLEKDSVALLLTEPFGSFRDIMGWKKSAFYNKRSGHRGLSLDEIQKILIFFNKTKELALFKEYTDTLQKLSDSLLRNLPIKLLVFIKPENPDKDETTPGLITKKKFDSRMKDWTQWQPEDLIAISTSVEQVSQELNLFLQGPEETLLPQFQESHLKTK